MRTKRFYFWTITSWTTALVIRFSVTVRQLMRTMLLPPFAPRKKYRRNLVALLLSFGLTLTLSFAADRDDLAKRSPRTSTRWSSFENPTSEPGRGGRDNRGAKGRAWERMAPHETKTLLKIEGPGEIRRIWITVSERDSQLLRALRFQIYWDGAKTPAVSVPFGDFFGALLGRSVAFENELFANPEGRSFNCYIPMPFRKGALVTLTNDSDRVVTSLFYDIDVVVNHQADPDDLYFHATWRRERPTTLRRDFEILPRVEGEGRFLGVHLAVLVNRSNPGWWGEGEVKMYLDGDNKLPSLVGTGTEDYIGTGWGKGVFHGRFQGSLVSDDKAGQHGFYRYHIPDPVYFHKEIRITIQQIGGDSKETVLAAMNQGLAIEAVSISLPDGTFIPLLEPATPLKDTSVPNSAWVNFYRQDDWSAVALFYLDRPENGLPPLPDASERTAEIDGRTQP
jgi:hypothetical protein